MTCDSVDQLPSATHWASNGGNSTSNSASNSAPSLAQIQQVECEREKKDQHEVCTLLTPPQYGVCGCTIVSQYKTSKLTNRLNILTLEWPLGVISL